MGARRSESNADETPREVYSQACFRGGRLFTLGLSCVALGHNKRNTLRKATNIGRCNSPLRKGKYVPSVMPSGSIFHSNCEAVVRSKFALNCEAPRPDCKPQDLLIRLVQRGKHCFKALFYTSSYRVYTCAKHGPADTKE